MDGKRTAAGLIYLVWLILGVIMPNL